MQPINYMPVQEDIGKSLAEGFALGDAIREKRMKRQQQEEAEAYKVELTDTLNSRDPQKLAALAAKYPKQGAGLKQAWELLSEDQRKSELSAGQEAWYALNSGQPEVALSIVDRHIEGMKNAGQDPKKVKALRDAIERDSGAASQNLGLFISTVAPKEFAETLAKLGGERRSEEEQPGKVKKLNAEASEAEARAASAAVAARFAESNAVADLEKKGWDVKKIANDIEVAKQNVKIAALNAKIAQSANQIARERLQLERDKAIQERDERVRTKTAEVESARANMDNFLNTADRIVATPMNVVGSAAGPVSARMPTLSQDTADFEALVENLDAQAFLSQIPQMKGAGALSDAEGKKLAAALQNFSLRQSPERLIENVKEAQRLILKARTALSVKHGIPDTVPDTPAASTATQPDEVGALIKKYAPGFRQ